MTLSPIVRVFFAIDLPAPIKTSLAKFISALKRQSKSKGIRWSRPENLHITLQFLPEVNANDLLNLITHVKAQLTQSMQLNGFTLGGLQVFPNAFRPRIINFDIIPQTGLATLSQLIGTGIEMAGYAIEARPYKAHLTIGRIKHIEKSLRFLHETDNPAFPPIPIEQVILFRSDPQPEGSQYTILERIDLIR